MNSASSTRPSKEASIVLVAETEEGEAVGFALAKLDDHPGVGDLSDMYVSGRASTGRGSGARAQVAARLREPGPRRSRSRCRSNNSTPGPMYERLGLRRLGDPHVRPYRTDLLERSSQRPRGESFGSVHVQTDDESAVAQAVQKYVPRFGRSGGSVVAGPRNGWVTVYDELSDREPATLRRLGSELSSAPAQSS